MFQRMSAGKHSSHGCGWLLSSLVAPPCISLLVCKAGTIIPPLGQPRGLIFLAAELSEAWHSGLAQIWGQGYLPGPQPLPLLFVVCDTEAKSSVSFTSGFTKAAEHPTTTWVTPQA